MNSTVRFNQIDRKDTIPLVSVQNKLQLVKTIFRPGEVIDNYCLIACITKTGHSEVWYCKDSIGYQGIMKLTTEYNQSHIIQMISEIDSDYLVPVLAYGEVENYRYEVTPYYKNGNLKDSMEVETIKKIVLPSICKALEELHQVGIIHNDIKPENLYWDDDMKKVLLGDYGNASLAKEKPNGITPSYAAPELLLRDVARRATDWCSVGLTIASLVSSKEIVTAKSSQQALREWEKGIRFTHNDYSFQQLINGMINSDPRKRLGPNAVKKWCGDEAFGGEERTSSHKEKEKGLVTVVFNNPSWIAADIEGLLYGIETHWEYSVFLFQQAQLDRFLLQYDKNLINYCRELRKIPNAEDALYRLTYILTKGQAFIWRGKRYSYLLDMENIWDTGDEGERDIIAFLQRGHVIYYLKQTGAVVEKIEFVKRLQDLSRIHPFEACEQLFQALRGDDGIKWNDTILYDLNDLVLWLMTRENDLEDAISEIFNSKRFEAWFAYQGMNDVLDTIRRRCKE